MSRLILRVCLVAAMAAAASAQQRDAASVLADVRKALGGDAALDAVQTLSVDGSVTESHAHAGSKGFAVELFAMLPGHFLHVKRDASVGGPMPIDITYYRGFREDELIRRTDSNIPFPSVLGPQTPEAIAKRERAQVQSHKREFARLFLVLFGKSPEACPLQFTYVGSELMDTQHTEVLEATTADGFAMRLYVDTSTYLPAALTWQSPPTVIMTLSSTAVVRGGQLVSQAPPPPVPAGDPTAGLPLVTRRLIVSDFKRQDGLNWPHRLREMVDAQVTEDTRLGRFKINPKIDARRFNIR